ncbi:MAG: glycosyltransferase family 2 protein [Paludibacter sp.]|nr:glycosyltransferase family 2 protein [Paludibacter sp.]
MLNASIVLYNHTVSEITPLVQVLKQSGVVSEIFLIDNSFEKNTDFDSLEVNYIFTGRNLGYGRAHNIALRKTIESGIPYHLVINPDISFDPKILLRIVDFMDKNTEIGQLMPKVFYPDGQIQYLCKLLPTPFDLIFRRFLPKSWTQKRMEHFELRASGYDRIMDVPYLSGCFMFLRTDALKNAGLFDERFFMYPEDIDLTRRIHKLYRTVFYPEVSIVHHHAQSSYVNLKMLCVHVSNMIRYFNKWGWFFDQERKEINAKILKQLP